MHSSQFGQYDFVKIGEVDSSMLSIDKDRTSCSVKIKLPVALRHEVITSAEDETPYYERTSPTGVWCHISDALLVSPTGQQWLWKHEPGADTIKRIYRGQFIFYKLIFKSDFAAFIKDGTILSISFKPKDYKATLQTISRKLTNNDWVVTSQNAASLLPVDKENRQRRVKHD